MADPCHVPHAPHDAHDDTLPRPPDDLFTYEERKRLDALGARGLWRIFVYMDWLTTNMPHPSGMVLFLLFALCCGGLGVGLVMGLLYGIVLLCQTSGTWLLWFALGVGLGLGVRALVRDAAATELRVRRSTKAKQRAWWDKEMARTHTQAHQMDVLDRRERRRA